MNNATASLQSTLSFLLLTTLCSTISPSHMHTLGRGMAEKKGSALSATKHNKYTKCFYSFANRGKKWQCINEQEGFWFSEMSDSWCFVALFRTCQKWELCSMNKVYTCCYLKTTQNWKAGMTLELDSASVTRAKGSVCSSQTKYNTPQSPWERDGLHCIRQDQPLRNISVPFF